ncbi:MAG: hypothetical protein AAF607_14105 [Pseudomonadota bacterium]
MKHSVLTWACAATVIATSGAHAATSFTDRNTFIAQTSPQVSVDFNNVPLGTSFYGQETTIGNMTFAGGTNQALNGWHAIAPGGNCTGPVNAFYTVDGSPFACTFVEANAQLRIDFNTDVTSWGADFRDLGDEERKTKLTFYDDSDVIAEYIAGGNDNGEVTFVGLDLDGAQATHLIFSLFQAFDPNQDLFGMDNVLFSTARGTGTVPNPVPVPPAMLLFASAGAAFAGMRRARSKAKSA